VPVNPFREETVIVDEPVDPTTATTLVGLTFTAKSWTVYMTAVE